MTPYVQNSIFLNSRMIPEVSLREGQNVFVRVLSADGGGKYTVSFAGSRFAVTSRASLLPGESFSASVRLSADGTVLLDPLLPSENAASSPGSAREAGDAGRAFGGAEFSALYAMLSAEGFVPDELSARLFLFLQQTGVRIDRELMAKARSVALRFPGRESRAAEAAALLLQDGIECSEENVHLVLGLFAEDFAGFAGGHHSGQGGENGGTGGGQTGGGDPHGSGEPSGSSGADVEQTGNSGHDGAESGSYGGHTEPFVEQVQKSQEIEDENFLKKIYGDGCTGKGGFLTFLNQVRGGDNHWIFLPYEWAGPNGNCTGIIRILLNLTEKITKKIEINLKSTVANYDFVLYFRESKVKEVRFCTLPPLLPAEVKSEELRLGGILSSGMNLKEPVAVTYSSSACIGGICATNEVPPFVEEKA